MEQLANFVTKSFEYNNNRVLDIINQAVRPTADDKKEFKSISENVFECEDESSDVDITDVEISSDSENKSIKSIKSKSIGNCISDISDNMVNTNGLTEKPSSPIALIKKLNRDGSKHITKNWLISDVPKRKSDINNRQQYSQTSGNPVMCSTYLADCKNNNQENANALNLIHIDDLVNKKQVAGIPFRPKPVTELLKQIREINNSPPILSISDKNNHLKMELEDEKYIKSGN